MEGQNAHTDCVHIVPAGLLRVHPNPTLHRIRPNLETSTQEQALGVGGADGVRGTYQLLAQKEAGAYTRPLFGST